MSTQEILNRIVDRLERLERMMNEETDEILDVDGIQELTKLSKSAIYQKTCSRNGAPPQLPHYRQGKRLYFRKSEIVTWLTARPIMDRAAIEAEAMKHMRRSRR
jgi:predicted DNA-binding transcriptional regulator AlpA